MSDGKPADGKDQEREQSAEPGRERGEEDGGAWHGSSPRAQERVRRDAGRHRDTSAVAYDLTTRCF